MTAQPARYPDHFQSALEVLGQKVPSTLIATRYGPFRLRHHVSVGGKECLSCATEQTWGSGEVATVRIHSACISGESLYSSQCDCREQLDAALKLIGQKGGAVIYLFQEGRGIGVCGKILAMEMERIQGMSTAEAFRTLGYDPDPRCYIGALEALGDLALPHDIRLITNNPHKIQAVEDAGFRIVERLEPKLRLHQSTIDFVRNMERALGKILYENIELEED